MDGVRPKKDSKCKEAVSVLLTPGSLDHGQGYHDENCGTKRNVHKEEIASGHVELQTLEARNPVVKVDTSGKTALLMGKVIIWIEVDVVDTLDLG
mmetsp:Transcript_18408/g.26673  ORF Transcript_18408/g.26673 Transcript_18408/m.26673 type:complete len:95 (+) Transcript_18408:779-1063(+)